MSHAGSISEHTLTTSWTRYTSTFTMPSDYLTGKTIGANSFNRLQLRQPEADTSTTAWVLDVTGVQLEVGSVDTDFEHRSYGEELALCQRYYNTAGLVLANGTPQRYHNQINLPVEMRASPSITTAAVDSGSGGIIAPTWDRENNNSSRKVFYQGANHSSVSSGRFTFDAEL